jgi:hypothetical protein
VPSSNLISSNVSWEHRPSAQARDRDLPDGQYDPSFHLAEFGIIGSIGRGDLYRLIDMIVASEDDRITEVTRRESAE